MLIICFQLGTDEITAHCVSIVPMASALLVEDGQKLVEGEIEHTL